VSSHDAWDAAQFATRDWNGVGRPDQGTVAATELVGNFWLARIAFDCSLLDIVPSDALQLEQEREARAKLYGP
jgi:hypothetical protein